MNHPFEIITNLQYSLKTAECRIRQFESGDLYRELKELHAKDARNYERTIRDLEKEQ